MVDWPSELPQYPLADGWRETGPDNVVRTPMDVGPAKVRRRSTSAPWTATAAFRLTAAQLATFRAFLAVDLADRSLSYDWAHPVSGADATWRITEPPQLSPIAGGLYWRVDLTLEQVA